MNLLEEIKRRSPPPIGCRATDAPLARHCRATDAPLEAKSDISNSESNNTKDAPLAPLPGGESAGAITIEPMDFCLHGRPCRHLAFDGHNICDKNGERIFALSACPVDKWGAATPALLTGAAPTPPAADCEHCPACGTWDYRGFSGKRLCFHQSYFIGKAGNPVDVQTARADCPLKKQ